MAMGLMSDLQRQDSKDSKIQIIIKANKRFKLFLTLNVWIFFNGKMLHLVVKEAEVVSISKNLFPVFTSQENH